MYAQSFSHDQLFATPQTVASQAPLSMEFSRQEYWSEVPFSTPGDLPDTGIEPVSPVSSSIARWIASAGDIRDMGSIPGLGRSPGKGHGNPLQYSCLENPMNRGAWQTTVHGVTKNWTRLSD